MVTKCFDIELAKTEAKKSMMSKQYAAFLIYRNKILSIGHNYSTKISSKNEYCLL